MRKLVVGITAVVAVVTVVLSVPFWLPSEPKFEERFTRIESGSGTEVYQSTTDSTTWWLIPAQLAVSSGGIEPGRIRLEHVLMEVASRESCALLLRRAVFDVFDDSDDHDFYVLGSEVNVQIDSIETEVWIAAMEKIGVRFERGYWLNGSPVLVVHFRSEEPEENVPDWVSAESDF